MEDLHKIFGEFRKEFPQIQELNEALGKEIHEASGPLDEKTRSIIKIVISGACNHKRALETQIRKAKAIGVTDNEVKHALLLLIQTVGFPTFMKSYSVFKGTS